MNRARTCWVWIAAVLTFMTAQLSASDPGIPDTVKITGGPLVVGQSRPLQLTIVNDELIGAYSLGFRSLSADGGFAIWDSAVYINRLADPSVFSYRIERSGLNDPFPGVPPDTLVLGADQGPGQPLPLGNGAVIDLYFTGLTPGVMSVDSAFFPPVGYFLLSGVGGIISINPQFVTNPIQIIEGHLPPTLQLSAQSLKVAAGAEVTFDIEATSPDNFPLTLQILSLTGYDDENRMPANSPILSSGNPASFQWLTTPSDIGIWAVTFKACDSTGNCATASTDIQVVESEAYLLSWDISSTPNVCFTHSLLHGNFDTTSNLEILMTGDGVADAPTFQLCKLQAEGAFSEVFSLTDGCPKYGSHVGYFNDDPNLDVITLGWVRPGYATLLLLGDGNNSFTISGTANDGSVTRSSALGEFSGDNHLDIATAYHTGVKVFAGNGQGGFQFQTQVTTDSALTVNSGDFNSDGFDDLAVGTRNGVRIYLSNGAGSFTLAHFYSQTYGSVEIEVTNQGSDFNNDNIFDLCISTPSVGGTSSELVVYLGNGDGSFSQQVIRNAEGQIFGNCVGDFNSDGQLDIALVNGAHRYVAILFGDGTGVFDNEIRFWIPYINPQRIDAFDADLDGDLDIVVVANGGMSGNKLFYLENQLDPSGFSRRKVEIEARNNAEIELISSTGKVFNQIKNTMPSGEYYERDLDQLGSLDVYTSMGLVESGQYTLSTRPKPNLPVGENFSLEFNLDGKLYRLAKDLPMTPEGYDFSIYAAGLSAVAPRPGTFSQANPPAFAWPGSGQFDFQLASDIDFSNLIVQTTVTGSSYNYPTAFPVADTVTYYWRVKTHGAPEYDCLYVLNLVPWSPTSGDADGNGIVNIADIVYLVRYIFNDGPAPVGEVDCRCDEIVNIADIVCWIQFIFAGGPGGC